MSVNTESYNLIYVDFDNTINIVNKDTWIKNNTFTLDKNSLTKLNVVFNFSKITQIHTGEYIFINENCNLCICDSKFMNAKLLTNADIYYKGVTQLSNYLIALIAPDGSIHCITSLKKMLIIPYYNDGTVYSSIKQTSYGKVIMVDGVSIDQSSDERMCGDTYTFDLTKEGLKNKTILPIDNSYKSRITIATPDNTQILNLNCDKKNKHNVYKYNFVYDLNISLPKSPCDDTEVFENGLCYTKCRDEFKGEGPVCWKKCDEGWIDDGAFCRKTNACEDDEDHDGGLCYPKCRDGYRGEGPVCWKNKALTYDRDVGKIPSYSCPSGYNLDGLMCRENCRDGFENRPGDFIRCWNKKYSYDRDIGIAPDYGKCNESGLSDVKYYPLTCTGCKKKKWGVCWEYATRDREKECKSNRQLEDGLCYKKPDPGFKCSVTVCTSTEPLSYPISSKESIKTCSSDRVLQAGMCYEKPRDEYKCDVTVCSLQDASYGRGSGKPDTLIKDKYSYGRGEGKFPKNYDPITCGTNCCSFDLTFFNNNYYKPTGLIMDDLPVKENLVAYYNAESFLNGVWYDLTDNLNNAVYIKGNIQKTNNYLTGTTTSSILFPFDILPEEYTILHVCKYNGTTKGKILSGYQSKWSSGFASGKSGVAIHENWITQSELSVFDDKWVFSTDTNNSYRANLNDYTTVQSNFTSQTQLSINLNDLPEENSEWAIACIIVFDRKLSLTEIDLMEKWLTNKYADLWSQTYYKTFKQLGYDCFDNKIGMITNNYSNYEFATYSGEKIDCKWLNYPQKNQLTASSCGVLESAKTDTEEGFGNLYNYFFDSINIEFIIKLIILVIILSVLIKNKKNDKF